MKKPLHWVIEWTLWLSFVAVFAMGVHYAINEVIRWIRPVKPPTPVDYAVGLLFSHQGCKVYRFTDKGQFVYFSHCEGNGPPPPETFKPRKNNYLY